MFGNGRVDFEGFVRVVLSAEFAFGLGNRNGGGKRKWVRKNGIFSV